MLVKLFAFVVFNKFAEYCAAESTFAHNGVIIKNPLRNGGLEPELEVEARNDVVLSNVREADRHRTIPDSITYLLVFVSVFVVSLILVLAYLYIRIANHHVLNQRKQKTAQGYALF